MSSEFVIVVVGGGIAGISCIEGLCQDFAEEESCFTTIVLISESELVKRITNYESHGRQLEWFNVEEASVEQTIRQFKPDELRLISLVGRVSNIDANNQILTYTDGKNECDIKYNVICLCTGSKPRHLVLPENRCLPKEVVDNIVVIRDVRTVIDLKERLAHCRRIVILGNGGISLELVDKIAHCDKVWVVRDDSVGLTFFDSGASKFLLDARLAKEKESSTCSKKATYSSTSKILEGGEFGPSLGPDWCYEHELRGKGESEDSLDIIYNDEILDVCHSDSDYPMKVTTKSGRVLDCDLIATAIGVIANPPPVEGQELRLSVSDGGIIVDEQMRTSVGSIYAAGDVVSCVEWSRSDLWFQMRLWVQARQMGYYAGRCIAEHLCGRDPSIYFNFDCFTHCTHFFDYKLILLGRYNGQTLTCDDASDCEVVARVKPGKDYVKLVIKKGQIIGAVLVGESGLEETIENLIRDKIDVSDIKDHILDDTVDIEDYFD